MTTPSVNGTSPFLTKKRKKEQEQDTEEEIKQQQQQRKKKEKLERKSNGIVKITSALHKRKMLPHRLQHPLQRQVIWKHVEQMLSKRRYRWVQDRPSLEYHESLLPPNNHTDVLHWHTKHAEHETLEPIYVVFVSKLREMTLKVMESFPSRHILLVTDTLTPRGRKALDQFGQGCPPTRFPHDLKEEIKDRRTIFMEVFTSSAFLFDLPNHDLLSHPSCVPLEDAQERKRILDLYGHDLDKYPQMYPFDPFVSYYRIPSQTLIDAHRPSVSSGTTHSYWVVKKN